jgi:hypothetical protein
MSTPEKGKKYSTGAQLHILARLFNISILLTHLLKELKKKKRTRRQRQVKENMENLFCVEIPSSVGMRLSYIMPCSKCRECETELWKTDGSTCWQVFSPTAYG